MKKISGPKGTVLYMLLVGVILCGSVWFLDDVYALFNGAKPKDLVNKNEGKNEIVECTWNGIYTDDTNNAKIYKEENSIKVYNKYALSNNKNLATLESDSTTKLTCENNKVTYKKDNKSIEYTKKSDYTMTDYFGDKFGDADLALTEHYNGIFSNDIATIKMYQISETEVNVIMILKKDNSNTFSKATIIDGIVTYEDTNKNFKIEIDKTNIKIKSNPRTIVHGGSLLHH